MNKVPERLKSLDVFRGITMFLLIAEAALVYEALGEYLGHDSWLYPIVLQFHHHPWNGLRFWDLIQPFFMFIVGVSMPFSAASRSKKGDSERLIGLHILKRCAILLFLGTTLHHIYNDRLVWELWNVLSQLSFTILVAFFLMKYPIPVQLVGSLTLLLLTEILYRMYDPGAPFVKDQNFGSWMDLMLMGKINDGGGWVTINCLPTAAHTIWGVICGQLLMSRREHVSNLRGFVVWGAIAIIIGYGLDWFSVTPIVKRIATTSFVLASGGWCLLVLAFLFWLVDLKKINRWTFPFTVVGMNSIFIYMFSETVGKEWVAQTVLILTEGIVSPFDFQVLAVMLLNSLLVLLVFWYLCYIFYRKEIFIKI